MFLFTYQLHSQPLTLSSCKVFGLHLSLWYVWTQNNPDLLPTTRNSMYCFDLCTVEKHFPYYHPLKIFSIVLDRSYFCSGFIFFLISYLKSSME